MTTVYLGIGSNLGNREDNCARAISLLDIDNSGIRVQERSELIETEPWGVEDQPKFINMAVRAETGLSPVELLSVIKNIEQEMGRASTCAQRRWGPRLIDIDILFYGDLVLDTPELRIPHPLMHERAFVLGPLSQIAPQVMHPVLNRTVSQLISELDEL